MKKKVNVKIDDILKLASQNSSKPIKMSDIIELVAAPNKTEFIKKLKSLKE
jgi:hypothetical protein